MVGSAHHSSMQINGEGRRAMPALRDWVFFEGYGDPIGRLDKSWKNDCKATELDGRLSHDFRNFLWVKKICQQSIKGEL